MEKFEQEEILRKFDKLFWKIARRYESLTVPVDDLYQEARISVWQSFARYDPSIATQVTWIYTYAKKGVLLCLQNNKYIIRCPQNAWQDGTAREMCVSMDAAIRVGVTDVRQDGWIDQVLRNLIDNQRMAMELYVEGLPDADIGRAMRVSTQSARQCRMRAVCNLRKTYPRIEDLLDAL